MRVNKEISRFKRALKKTSQNMTYEKDGIKKLKIGGTKKVGEKRDAECVSGVLF